jgi:hypothetical protein
VQGEFLPDMAMFYDLIIGLHPDGATRAVVEAALFRPVLLVPCCNEWDKTRKLGAKELVDDIVGYLTENGVKTEIVEFDIKKPKNIGIITC